MSLALKPVVYESITVGEEFAPINLTADRSFLMTNAFSVDDFSEFIKSGNRLLPGEVFSGAHLLAEMLRLLNTKYDPFFDRGLHQREEVWFKRAPRLNESISLRGKVTDKYLRRGRAYFVVEAEAISDDHDDQILLHRATEAVGIGDTSKLGSGSSGNNRTDTPSRRVEGNFDEERVVTSLVPERAVVGDCLQASWKELTQAQIAVYSNVAAGWRTTHTDISVAKEEGLDTTIAQGLMGACYITELARGHLPHWDERGHLNVAFIKPMFPGDHLRARGCVIGASETGEIELEVWLENQRGEKTVVGWAKVSGRGQ